MAFVEIVELCQAREVDLTGKAHILERYAITKEAWRQCAAALELEGQTLQTETGWQRNPRCVDFTQFGRLLQTYSVALGITPVIAKPKQHPAPADKPPEPVTGRELVFKFPRSG